MMCFKRDCFCVEISLKTSTSNYKQIFSVSLKMKTVCIIDMVVLLCLIQILIGSSYGLPSTSLGNQSRNNTSSRKLATVHITVTFTKPSTIENGTRIEKNATTEERILISISSTLENGTRIETNATTEEGTLITISSTLENGTRIKTNATTEKETLNTISSTTENETITIETNATTEEETLNTIPSTTERGARVTSSPATTPATMPKTLDPYCPPKYCLSHTTYKCESHYEWVRKENELLSDSRLLDVAIPKGISSVDAIGRLVDAIGNVYPCYVSMRDFGEVMYSSCFITPDNFEVLFLNCGHYGWIKPLNGSVPENAIVGGKKGNETTYICRMDAYSVGWMQPSIGLCYVYKPSRVYKEYELMVYLD